MPSRPLFTGVALLMLALVACGGGDKKLDLKGVPQDGTALGNADAPMKIKLYANLTCETCKSFEERVLPKLVDDYVKPGKVQLTFVHVPLGPTAASQGAHQAAACAGDQDKLWNYTKVLFDKQTKKESAYTNEQLKKYGDDAGVDHNTFDPCLDQDRHKDDVQAGNDAFDALASKGLRLPVLEFSDLLMSGTTNYDEVKLAVEDERQQQ